MQYLMLMKSWMQFFSKLALLLSKKTSLSAANIFWVTCDRRISHQDSSQLAFTCYKLIIETLEIGVSTVSIVDFEQVYVCWIAEIVDSDELFPKTESQLESTQVLKMELFAKIFNGWKPSTTVAESSILNVRLGWKCASAHLWKFC